MSDQSTPAVQPGAEEAGQGGEETQGSGLYDLASAPEEYRPFIEAELKKIEGNTTRKFQEASEFRKRWEPFEALGVADVPEQELSELLELRQIAQDPEAFDSWLKAMAEQRGLLGGGSEAGEDDDDDDGIPDVDIAALVAEKVNEALAPHLEQFRSQGEEQRMAEMGRTIEADLDKLSQQHGDFDRERVCQLALAYADDDDAIAKGFADYQEIRGGAERSFVESKAKQPNGAVDGAGRQTAAQDEIKSFSDAKKAAQERFRASR